MERANLTLQDRLVKELRLRGIDDMEVANAYLPEFVADHNRRFAVASREAEDARRPVLRDAYGVTMTMCVGGVFVGPANSVVYVEDDGGAGSGSNGGDSDGGSGTEGGDPRGDVPTTEAECDEVGGTWKENLHCDMPMDEHISADCGCYQNGEWVSFVGLTYPHCVARQALLEEEDPANVCQWPFP